jgi:hypothetical protein
MPKLTTGQMRIKCHQLYTGIQEQALDFLLTSVRARAEARELGLRPPSESDIAHGLQAYADHDYGSVAGFHAAIAKQRRSVADVRFLVATTLLEAKLAARVEAHAERLGNDSQATIYKLILENIAKQRARTSCNPGYRASECKQYGSATAVEPAPTVVLEHFRKGIA